MNTFKKIRNSLSIDLQVDPEVYDGFLQEYDANRSALPSYEVIIAEVRNLFIVKIFDSIYCNFSFIAYLLPYRRMKHWL